MGDLVPCEHQVAGWHSGSLSCVLKNKKGQILKPLKLNANPTYNSSSLSPSVKKDAEKEANHDELIPVCMDERAFYEFVRDSTKSDDIALKPLIPEYYGCQEVTKEDGQAKCEGRGQLLEAVSRLFNARSGAGVIKKKKVLEKLHNFVPPEKEEVLNRHRVDKLPEVVKPFPIAHGCKEKSHWMCSKEISEEKPKTKKLKTRNPGPRKKKREIRRQPTRDDDDVGRPKKMIM